MSLMIQMVLFIKLICRALVPVNMYKRVDQETNFDITFLSKKKW